MSDKNRRYYEKNKERLKKLAKERYRRNPEKYRAKNKEDRKKRGKEYWEEWHRRLKLELFFALGGQCESCGYDKPIMKAYIIHDVNTGHLTKKKVQEIIQLYKEGKVRLLCCRCYHEEEGKNHGC